MVPGSDDPDPEMTQRELAPTIQVAGVVEADGVAAIDESHASRADNLSAVTPYDKRGVLIDPDTEELAVRCDDEKEPLQTSSL